MVAEASLFSRYHTTQRKTHQIRKTTNTIPHHQVRNRISLRNHAKRVTVGAPNAWRKSRARRRLAANTALLAFDQRPKPCLASQRSVPFITMPAHYTAPCTHAHAAKKCIKKVDVLEYPELGMEAIWKIEVEDFPAFIVCDDKGNDFFKEFNM